MPFLCPFLLDCEMPDQVGHDGGGRSGVTGWTRLHEIGVWEASGCKRGGGNGGFRPKGCRVYTWGLCGAVFL